MNTFVPFTDFDSCARFLDNKRLTKQVAEAAQILRQLDQFPHGGWCHHPAVKMWVGYNEALWHYMCACERERMIRNMNPHKEMDNFPEYDDDTEYELPPWWYGPVHESHQKVLQAKWAGIPHAQYKHLYHWPKVF